MYCTYVLNTATILIHRRYWDRVVWSKFTGENTTVEPIPGYLTPDKNRGIEYSNEIIEMKGKLTLNPFQPEPKDAYVNDTFTHNQDMDVTNKIGSIRVQYDWLPRTDLFHEIEEEKLQKIAPLLHYVNHAAILQSTKVPKVMYVCVYICVYVWDGC